jgi:hypothetical protein
MKFNLTNIVEGRAREIVRVHGANAFEVARAEAQLARERGDRRGARQYALIAARIRELERDKPAS